MLQCILYKRTGDLDVTLLKDFLILNLPCEQATHEYIGPKNLLVL